MKPLKLLFVVLSCVWFTSCLEINEEVEIKANGSGSLSTTTDLSQLIDMMSAFGGEEFDKKKDEKMDTTFSMKALIDTSTKFTSAQKALLKDGMMSIKMDMAAKQFNFKMRVPFQSLENYQQLSALLSDGIGGMGTVMQGMMGGKNPGKGIETEKDSVGIIDQPAPIPSPDLDKITSVYDFNVSDGLIKKTVNQEKYKKLLENPQMKELEQGAGMGIELLYNTTYKLPRPVKKVSNPALKISDDKKTITMRFNLLEIFATPEKFEYSIEY